MWVLRGGGSFEHSKNMLRLIGKKILTILCSNFCFVFLDLCFYTCEISRSLVNSAYPKNIFSYFSTEIFLVGAQKNCLNETVLLSTQNIC